MACTEHAICHSLSRFICKAFWDDAGKTKEPLYDLEVGLSSQKLALVTGKQCGLAVRRHNFGTL